MKADKLREHHNPGRMGVGVKGRQETRNQQGYLTYTCTQLCRNTITTAHNYIITMLSDNGCYSTTFGLE